MTEEKKPRCHPNGRRFGETKKHFRERKQRAREAKQYRGRIKALQFENNVKAYGLAEAMRIAGMKDPDRRGRRMNVVRYKREYGSVVAVITKVGHKWAHMVWLDFPVRLRKVRVDELTYTEDLHEDLKATCEAMLDAGTRMGITKGAEDALNGVLASYGREAA